MRHILVLLMFVVMAANTNSTNAQFFRLGSSCANGKCGASRYTYSPYYSSCANGQCGSYRRPTATRGCTTNSCQLASTKSVPQTTSSTELNSSCSDNSCSIQSETATYDLADKLEVTYTQANVKCQGCGLLLGFPLTENAIWKCAKCERHYATKDGEVYNIIKKSDEGYLLHNGELAPGCTASQASKTDVALQKKLATPVATLIASINAVRARYGLRALATDAYLESGAYTQASFCSQIGRLQHASGVAEILAQNNQGLETAISQWLNSPGHRALLLSGSFRYAGVAVVRDRYGRVWCAVQFK